MEFKEIPVNSFFLTREKGKTRKMFKVSGQEVSKHKKCWVASPEKNTRHKRVSWETLHNDRERLWKQGFKWVTQVSRFHFICSNRRPVRGGLAVFQFVEEYYEMYDNHEFVGAIWVHYAKLVQGEPIL